MARQRLAGCLALTALAAQAARASEPDQQPLLTPDCASCFAPIDDPGVESQLGWTDTPDTALIALYPASRIYPDDLRDMGQELPGCKGEWVDENPVIGLEVDVCLSGEYYVRDNIQILQTPICPDGFTPKLMFYQNRGCTGSPRKVSSGWGEIQDRCLWSEEDISVPSYYWSLAFRCVDDTNADADQIDAPLEHQTAEPASIIQNVLGGAPGHIRNHHGTMFPCHSEHGNRTHTTPHKTDDCHWPLSSWELQTIEIVTPAVCANGTRAQLILYETKGPTGLGYGCNNHEMTLVNGIMDIDDWMLNTCIDMSRVPLLDGRGFGRALGRMFYCDGQTSANQLQENVGEEERELVEYEPRGSRVSHSLCPVDSRGWRPVNEPPPGLPRPPTYMYLKPMTCMSLPKDTKLRMPEKPKCADGSTGRLAIWDEASCGGMPKRITPINTLGCESWHIRDTSSYMVWCEGEEREGPWKELSHSTESSADGDKRAVLSVNDCPRLGTTMRPVGREDGPTIQRVHADEDCLNITPQSQLSVYKNAKCPNGREAKLTVWRESGCRRKPDRTISVKGFQDGCAQVCTDENARWRCSARFTC